MARGGYISTILRKFVCFRIALGAASRRSTMDEREMGNKVIEIRDLINNLLGSATSSERVDARRELVGAYVQVLEELAAARRTTPDRECEWKCDDVENGIWESSCGESWSFIDGGPVENRMLFCHGCGGKLKTAPNSENGEKP
jgi:hypothetical protein